MKVLLTIFSLLILVNCKKEAPQSESEDQTDTEAIAVVSRITKNDIESLDYADYGLSNTSKKAVNNWASYTELETLIESIKNGDLLYFENDDEILTAFIADLRSTVPDKVGNESVNARLTALETKFLKLKSAVKIRQTTKAELLATIHEFLEAGSNLNLQMNKKFEKEAQDISKNDL